MKGKKNNAEIKLIIFTVIVLIFSFVPYYINKSVDLFKIGIVIFATYILVALVFETFKIKVFSNKASNIFILTYIIVLVVVFILITTKLREYVTGIGFASTFILYGFSIVKEFLTRKQINQITEAYINGDYFAKKVFNTIHVGFLKLLFPAIGAIMIILGMIFIVFPKYSYETGKHFWEYYGKSEDENRIFDPIPKISKDTYLYSEPDVNSSKITFLRENESVVILKTIIKKHESHYEYLPIMTLGFSNEVNIGWVESSYLTETPNAEKLNSTFLFFITSFNLKFIKEGLLDGLFGFIIVLILSFFNKTISKNFGLIASLISIGISLRAFTFGPSIIVYILIPRIIIFPMLSALLLIFLARAIGFRRLRYDDSAPDIFYD